MIKYIKRYDRLNVLTYINTIKKKIKWLVSLNPTMLYIGYVIFLIIPYIPNISLYLILLNTRINKYVKYICLFLSVLFTIFYNILFMYLLMK